jgi:hypothetical protein
VITQDTAFGNVRPTGTGLFAFSTLDDALATVDAVSGQCEGHCRAARETAAEYFDAEKGLVSLMPRAGC